MSMCTVKVLDAVSLEERFKMALPMLTRQIEGLKLLQKTRKLSPDGDKRVNAVCMAFFLLVAILFMPVHAVCCSLRCHWCVNVERSRASSSVWMGTMKTRMVMTLQSWRGRSTGPTCLNLRSDFASKSSRGEFWP